MQFNWQAYPTMQSVGYHKILTKSITRSHAIAVTAVTGDRMGCSQGFIRWNRFWSLHYLLNLAEMHTHTQTMAPPPYILPA